MEIINQRGATKQSEMVTGMCVPRQFAEEKWEVGRFLALIFLRVRNFKYEPGVKRELDGLRENI